MTPEEFCKWFKNASDVIGEMCQFDGFVANEKDFYASFAALAQKKIDEVEELVITNLRR